MLVPGLAGDVSVFILCLAIAFLAKSTATLPSLTPGISFRVKSCPLAYAFFLVLLYVVIKVFNIIVKAIVI